MARPNNTPLTLFAQVKLDRARALPPQIAAHVRTLLATASLRAGDRLPSTRELAALWNTHVPIVHEGLTLLVQAGWLVRRSRSGTYVRNRPTTLKTIGLYYFGDRLSHPEAHFQRAVHHSLLNGISKRGLRWSLWNDPRPGKEAVQPWDLLENACRQGELSALIVPLVDRPHLDWLLKLPITQAFAGVEGIPNNVGDAPKHMIALAVRELARLGCRSAGLISAWPRPGRGEVPKPITHDAYQSFMTETRARGLAVREAWIVACPSGGRRPTSALFGYNAFRRLWACPQRPEGLIVVNDAESAGVTTAILELGIRVPDQLRLVYHKTREIDLLCPFPVTTIGGSAEKVAEALLRLIEQQFAGKAVEPIVIEPHIWKTSSVPSRDANVP